MNERYSDSIAGLIMVVFLLLAILSSRLVYDAYIHNHSNSKTRNALILKKSNDEPDAQGGDDVSERIDSGPNAKWLLCWRDEFSNGVVDETCWTRHEGGGIWGNNELQCYTARPQNCYVEDGKLKIKGCKEDYHNYNFTSARVSTKGKESFLYGRIEVRAKFPQGKGLLPAIWLLPCEDNYGDRRKNGEIDIVEILGSDPWSVYGVAHYSFRNHNRTYAKYNDGVIDFSKDFHVYSIEWTPDRIKWQVDGICYLSLDMKAVFDETYRPFSHRLYLIINLAIGGDWPGKDLSATAFPVFLEVDYVRYYRLGT